MKEYKDTKITKEEFDIPSDVEFKIDDKNHKYYINENGEKVILLEDGKMVQSKDGYKVTFYHKIDGEYFKHVCYLKDKKIKK